MAGATADLLRAGGLRHEGRATEALDLVCRARAILAQHLPPGDRTLITVDATIADLRADVARGPAGEGRDHAQPGAPAQQVRA